MEPAVFVARLMGPSLFVIGVGVLLNPTHYAAMITEAVQSPTLMYLAGLLTLPLGLAILNVYRSWTVGWRVIITILGWLLFVGGIIRIVLPRLTATLVTALYSTSIAFMIFGAAMLVLGGYLSFEGYRSRSAS